MIKFTLLTLLSLVLLSCNKPSNTQTELRTSSSSKLNKDSAVLKRISLNEAKKLVENQKTNGLTIIDLRTPQEYQSGHMENAINIDFYKNFKENINKLDKNKQYLIYCRSANRSRASLKIMKDLKFKNVLELDKGIKVWARNGWKLVR